MNDIEIIKGLVNNDMNCYEYLIDKYTCYVVAIIKKIANTQLSNQDIEELTSDVFIKIWQMRTQNKLMPDKLKAYIAKITRNMVLNRLRQRSIELIENEEDVIDMNTPEKEIIEMEVNNQILGAINKLPYPDKDIFLMRYFYMEKIVDIADKLQVPTNTVHTKLSRGKKKLETLLSQEGYVL